PWPSLDGPDFPRPNDVGEATGAAENLAVPFPQRRIAVTEDPRAMAGSEHADERDVLGDRPVRRAPLRVEGRQGAAGDLLESAVSAGEPGVVVAAPPLQPRPRVPVIEGGAEAALRQAVPGLERAGRFPLHVP